MSGVVLGLQGTVDYEVVWDSAILERIVEELGITESELDPLIPVDSERNLVIVLLALLRDGGGGERFVASSTIVETFARRFEMQITLGGTCVRAALGMRELGVSSMLHLVSTDENVRRLLPEDISYISSATRDTLDPHLILQYSAGTSVRIGDVIITAPHPNRVIFANDPPARKLLISDQLQEALTTASLFLVSGFNSIQEEDILVDRLARVAEAIEHAPEQMLVMFEDAGYHRPDFAPRVRTSMSGVVDVYSMNEDELQAHLDRDVDLLDLDDVARAMSDLERLIPGPILVVHTKYWAAAFGEGARRFSAALRGGITMASTRYLHGDRLDAARYADTGTATRNPHGEPLAAALQSQGGDRVAVEVGLILETATPTTIGLGDTFVGGFLTALAKEGNA